MLGEVAPVEAAAVLASRVRTQAAQQVERGDGGEDVAVDTLEPLQTRGGLSDRARGVRGGGVLGTSKQASKSVLLSNSRLHEGSDHD